MIDIELQHFMGFHYAYLVLTLLHCIWYDFTNVGGGVYIFTEYVSFQLSNRASLIKHIV